MNELKEPYQNALSRTLEVLEEYTTALTGGANLYIQGFTDEHPDDLDFLTESEGLRTAKEELDDWYLGGHTSSFKKGQYSTVQIRGTYQHVELNTDGTRSGILGTNRGIDIDLYGGIDLREESQAKNPAQDFEIDEVSLQSRMIPVISLEDEAMIHEKLGDSETAEQIRDHQDT